MRIEQSEFHDHLVRGLTHKMNNILSLFHGYLGMLMEDQKLDRDTMTGLQPSATAPMPPPGSWTA